MEKLAQALGVPLVLLERAAIELNAEHEARAIAARALHPHLTGAHALYLVSLARLKAEVGARREL